MNKAKVISAQLHALASPDIAAILQRFFKTGPGEYGEGDRFRGLCVPVLRKVARKYQHLPLTATVSLLQSDFHEDRLLALLIMIQRYYAGDAALRGEVPNDDTLDAAFELEAASPPN